MKDFLLITLIVHLAGVYASLFLVLFYEILFLDKTETNFKTLLPALFGWFGFIYEILKIKKEAKN